MFDPLTLLASAALVVQSQPVEANAQTAAQETDQSETASDAEKMAKNDDSKIICRRTAVIGSKFKKKICGTKKQWETLEARATATTQEMQRRGKGLEPVN